MFMNSSFEEIFLTNTKTLEVHAASKRSPQCNLDDGFNHKDFSIQASHNRAETIEMFKSLARQGIGHDFCGHCFPGLSKR